MVYTTTHRQWSSCVCVGVCYVRGDFCVTSSWTTSFTQQCRKFRKVHTNHTIQQVTFHFRNNQNQRLNPHATAGHVHSTRGLSAPTRKRRVGELNFPSTTTTQPAAAQDPPSLFATCQHKAPSGVIGHRKQCQDATSTLITHNMGRNQPS